MADAWMKFYPSDWMGEPKLKLVSRSARSLWLDMLCLMHQSGTGRLEVSGRPMTEKELAAILGDNPRTIKKLLAELADAGVSTIVDGSFIASSRMIKDFEKSERDKSNGRMGGSPLLKNKDLDEKGVNPQVKAQKPEARSQNPDKERDTNVSLSASDLFDEFWREVPKRVGKTSAQKAWAKAVKSAPPDEIIAAMRRYAAEREGKDPQFTAHPATWLNAGRWADEAASTQQDFHNMISQALGGNDAIPGPREDYHGQTQRLPAPLQAPGSPRPEYRADRAEGDGRGIERPYADLINPRRFGGPN